MKKDRLDAILNIIKNNQLGNQEDLLQHLHQAGFDSTQATLSRDIKSLKIIKYPDSNGNYVYTVPGDGSYAGDDNESTRLAIRGFLAIDFSGNLGVIKTRSGYAMGIASDIDSHANEKILGTIAGDDTILLIPREGVGRKEMLESLSKLIPSLKLQ